MKGEGKAVPLDVFGVGAEVGCVVDFVFEELGRGMVSVMWLESNRIRPYTGHIRYR